MASQTYLSPSCQHLIKTTLSPLHIIVRSCMSHPQLRPIITNHKCNNVALLPGGLYLDMARTIAAHIRPSEEIGYNVHNLEIHKPLVVRDESKMDELWLEMEVTASGSEEDVLMCRFWSIDAEGKRLQENGHCKVSFESETDWLSEWSHHAPMIQDRIDTLYTRAQKEEAGHVLLIQRSKAYELFQSFVDYSGNYQSMSEVVFDSQTLEATALLSFLPDPASHFCGPYYLDGSCHLSGFMCNAVEKDKEKNAFISNGVGAMKLSSRFRPEVEGAEIRTYVQMRPMVGEKGVLAGDVYVLQDGEVVGVWESVRFKKIPRRVLNVFLPPGKK